jgi:hypothetical protein
VFKTFYAIGGSFSKRFNASVRAVAYVTNHLVFRRRALHEKTISDTLNVASY